MQMRDAVSRYIIVAYFRKFVNSFFDSMQNYTFAFAVVAVCVAEVGAAVVSTATVR